MANQVVLTFAGETRSAESAFDRVGGAARGMESEVREAGAGFDRVGEAADSAEGKAQGFSDTLTGTKDIMGGAGEIAKGNLFEGFVMAGQGMADLAGGLFAFLIPSLKSAVTWLGNTRVGQLATAAATKIWAGAQWIMNSALLASPITWIVVGILAIVAVIVLIATKTDWFSKAWNASWGWIKRTAVSVWDWLKALPGRIGAVFGKIADGISAPFRAGFNAVARAWNNTVGRLSWTVPDWIPGIGGNHISVPTLPTFHAGGIVPGVPGTPTPILALAGERVGSTASRGGDMTLHLSSDGSLASMFLHAIRTRQIQLTVQGGRVTVANG